MVKETTVFGDFTAEGQNVFLVITSVGVPTIATLKSAVQGDVIYIKNTGPGLVQVVPQPGEPIDGSPNPVFLAPGESTLFFAEPGAWWRIAGFGEPQFNVTAATLDPSGAGPADYTTSFREFVTLTVLSLGLDFFLPPAYLPPAANGAGHEIIIYVTPNPPSPNGVQVEANGTDTIDGLSTPHAAVPAFPVGPGQKLRLISDGISNWVTT